MGHVSDRVGGSITTLYIPAQLTVEREWYHTFDKSYYIKVKDINQRVVASGLYVYGEVLSSMLIELMKKRMD